jgi:hypothetical protein
MKYKITNKKTGSSEVMNHEQICDRIMTCKGKFFDKYSKEHFSDTPIQDELNVRQFCWLDIIMTICTTSVVLLLIFEYFI